MIDNSFFVNSSNHNSSLIAKGKRNLLNFF